MVKSVHESVTGNRQSDRLRTGKSVEQLYFFRGCPDPARVAGIDPIVILAKATALNAPPNLRRVPMSAPSILQAEARSSRVSLAIAAAIISALAPVGVASPDTLAPQLTGTVTAFRGGSGHGGAFSPAGPQSFALRYSVTADDDVNAGVAIGSNGTAYMVSKDGVVRAINVSGAEVWKSALGAATVGSPVLTPDGELLVLGDQRGRVKAWHALTGEGAWVTPRYGQVLGAVAIGEEDRIWFLSTDQRLFALERDGSLHATVAMPADGIGSPAIGPDSGIYVATMDGRLRKYSSDGDPMYATDLPYAATTAPVVGPGSAVTIGVATEVIRIDGTNGAIAWRKSLGARIRSMPAVGPDGVTYVGTDDGRVVAIDPQGATAWTVQTGGIVLSSPALDALGTVYVGSGDATLYALDKSGRRVDTYRAFDAIDSPITIGPDGTVYAGSRDNRLYALRDNSRRFASSPADRVGGDLVRDSASGKVYAMINGTRRWIPDPITLSRLGLGSRLPVTVSPSDLSRVPSGADLPALTEGSTIRSSTGATYRIADGQRVWVPEGDTIAVDAPDQVVRTVPLQTSNGLAIKGTDDRVYIIEDGFRRWAHSPAALQGRGVSWSAVHLVTDSVRDALPLGVPIP